MGAVFAGWDDITVQIVPTSVIAWGMREADRQVFGGAFERNPGCLFRQEGTLGETSALTIVGDSGSTPV